MLSNHSQLSGYNTSVAWNDSALSMFLVILSTWLTTSLVNMPSPSPTSTYFIPTLADPISRPMGRTSMPWKFCERMQYRPTTLLRTPKLSDHCKKFLPAKRWDRKDKTNPSTCGHTIENAPDPVWSPQLSSIWHGQYYGRGRRGNTMCCRYFFIFFDGNATDRSDFLHANSFNITAYCVKIS